MKFGRMLGLTLATLLIAAPAVHAQDDDMGDLTTKRPKRAQTVEEENNDPSRSGPILGLGAVWALDDFSNVGASTDSSGGYNAHVGYRFNEWVSTDLEVERYQQFDAHANGSDVGEVNGWAVGLNERAYILHGRYQPWLELGINYLSMETTNTAVGNSNKTDDGCGLRFGGGLDVFATNHLVVTTDISYMLGVGEVDNFGVVAFSLGFQYRP